MPTRVLCPWSRTGLSRVCRHVQAHRCRVHERADGRCWVEEPLRTSMGFEFRTGSGLGLGFGIDIEGSAGQHAVWVPIACHVPDDFSMRRGRSTSSSAILTATRLASGATPTTPKPFRAAATAPAHLQTRERRSTRGLM